MKVDTYLNFGGNCKKAFTFYEKNLGGKILMMRTYAELPPSVDMAQRPQHEIMHARIRIGGSEVMASDAPRDRFEPMRSAYLSLTAGSDSEAERVHAVLAEGGQVFMPMQETFFASRFSMLRDKFGVLWMILSYKPEA
jgi:PhnB protein